MQDLDEDLESWRRRRAEGRLGRLLGPLLILLAGPFSLVLPESIGSAAGIGLFVAGVAGVAARFLKSS